MEQNQKKKILYVITKSNWGGSQRYLYDLITHLPSEQFEVVVAFGGTGAKGAPTGRLAKLLDEKNIRTILVKNFMRDISMLEEFKSLSELKYIMQEEKPDIVHLNSSKAGGIGALAARLAGVPKIVYTIHGLAHNEPRPLPVRILLWFATWATFSLCTDLICITQLDQKQAKKIPFIKKRLHLIYNGIAPEQVMHKTDAQAAFIQHSPALKEQPEDTVWIGTGTELIANKGVEYLIRAVKVLHEQGRSFVLVIVGTGELKKTLERLAQVEGVAEHVVFTDFFPNLGTHLAAFDVFVLASLKEGLPYILLETGIAAVPTIATNIGGIPEVIVPDDTGLLVPPKSQTALAGALERIIDMQDRERLGKTHQKRIMSYFALEDMVEKTTKVYK